MTFTKETNCSAITLLDDEFTLFYDEDAPETTTITIEIKHNCEDNPISLSVLSTDDFEYAGGVASFVITPEILEQDTPTLDDGVYHIELTVIKEDGNYYNVEICVAVLCTAICEAVSYLANNLGSDIHKYVVALEDWVNSCDACDCSKACIIYTFLRKLLDDEVENPCNCN